MGRPIFPGETQRRLSMLIDSDRARAGYFSLGQAFFQKSKIPGSRPVPDIVTIRSNPHSFPNHPSFRIPKIDRTILSKSFRGFLFSPGERLDATLAHSKARLSKIEKNTARCPLPAVVFVIANSAFATGRPKKRGLSPVPPDKSERRAGPNAPRSRVPH